MNPIQIQALTAGWPGRPVLDDLNLDVPAGSITALVGRNGAGKSTLMAVLAGLLRPRSGSVSVLGLDPARAGTTLRRSIGIVPEQAHWPRWARVRDVLRLWRAHHPTWSEPRARELEERFGLDPAEHVRNLSKGRRAALALCCALAHEPRILLLDEPLSGLDAVVRRDVVDTVLCELRDDSVAVLIASHALGDLGRLADRVAFLDGGRITRADELEDLVASFVRVRVRLQSERPWRAPGKPLTIGDGRERVLVYGDASAEVLDRLQADPEVKAVRMLPCDFEELALAVEAGEVS